MRVQTPFTRRLFGVGRAKPAEPSDRPSGKMSISFLWEKKKDEEKASTESTTLRNNVFIIGGLIVLALGIASSL